MEKLTIHRALAELKLVGSRIENQIANFAPSNIVQKDKTIAGIAKDVFEARVVAEYQSIIDLIDRRNKIKSAIVFANSNTKVEVAGKELTIADAINQKIVIETRKSLLANLKGKHAQTKVALEKNNAKVDADALQLAGVMAGKPVKSGADDLKNVQPFLDSTRFHLVDPLKADEVIAKLEKEIGDFEAEVDATLSEVNATTFVEF